MNGVTLNTTHTNTHAWLHTSIKMICSFFETFKINKYSRLKILLGIHLKVSSYAALMTWETLRITYDRSPHTWLNTDIKA